MCMFLFHNVRYNSETFNNEKPLKKKLNDESW